MPLRFRFSVAWNKIFLVNKSLPEIILSLFPCMGNVVKIVVPFPYPFIHSLLTAIRGPPHHSIEMVAAKFPTDLCPWGTGHCSKLVLLDVSVAFSNIDHSLLWKYAP